MKKPRAGSATPRTDLSKASGPTTTEAGKSGPTASTPAADAATAGTTGGGADAAAPRSALPGNGASGDDAVGTDAAGTAAQGGHHPEATLRFADTPPVMPASSDEPSLAAAMAAAESRPEGETADAAAITTNAAPAAAAPADAVTDEPRPVRGDYTSSGHVGAADAPRRRGGAGGILAVVLLILILGALAATPFWAPIVVPLLPWGAEQAANQTEQQQLQDISGRVQALESRPAAAPAQPAQAADTGDLKAALDALDKRVAGMEQRVASAGSGGVDPAAVEALRNDLQRQTAASNQKLDELNQRIAGIDRKVDSRPTTDPAVQQALQGLQQSQQGVQQAQQGTQQALQGLQNDMRRIAVAQTELSDRVSRMEAQASQQVNAGRADQALLLAVGQLRDAVSGSRPYAAELGAVQALGRDRPNVLAAAQPLTARAQTGVPSLAVLRQRFNDAATAIVQAEESPPSQDFGQEVLGKLRSLVTVRHTGAAPENRPAQGAVAQAESALNAGDLAGAVAALDKLSGPAAEAAKPWLDDARARLAAEGAVAKLDQLLVARLTSESGGGSGGSGSSSASAGTDAVATGVK
ncbi:MAG TPA: mitofilin family membrane protein [Stellaceae bacterium]